MNAKTDPLQKDVVFAPVDLPPAVGGLVFYATRTPNVYVCVDAGVAFPVRLVVDADGVRGACGCGGDIPCAHMAALYSLPTPPVDQAPQLISVFFTGTDAAATVPTTEVDDSMVEVDEPKTGVAAITKSGVKVSLRAKVIQLWDSTSPAIGQVGLLADDAGKIKFVKWANADLTNLVEGMEYDFANMLTDEYNGKMSVKLDKNSRITKVREQGDDAQETIETPTPTPVPAPTPTPVPVPEKPKTKACRYCGEILDLSDMDAVLDHIEKCKNNNTPHVPDAPRIDPDTKTPTTVVDTTDATEDVPVITEDKDVYADLPDHVVSTDDAMVMPTYTPDETFVAAAPVDGARNIAMAMCRVQQTELFAITDSENPFHNSKYADLSSVWAVIRKPLTDNGLCVIQTTEPYDGGITVVTTLMHISGETLVARLSCEVPPPKKDKNGHLKPNIQGLGSTITYLRRYSLGAMIGVCPVDDDAESAHGRR